MSHMEEHDDIPGMDDISLYDMRDLFEQAVDDGEIDVGQASYGIALQVLDEDRTEPLSVKQQEAFDVYIRPILVRRATALAVKRRIDSMPD